MLNAADLFFEPFEQDNCSRYDIPGIGLAILYYSLCCLAVFSKIRFELYIKPCVQTYSFITDQGADKELSMLEQFNERGFQDLNYATKKQIIQGLEEHGGEDACYSLIEFLYEDQKPVRELAMNSLTRIGTTEVIGGLLPLLHENDAEVRSMAMEVIREIAYDRISLLVPFLEYPYEPTRIAIADLLGLIGNPDAVKPLISSLEDMSPHVRSSALASLGKLADERAVGAIEKLLETEHESWVIFSCIKSLEKIGGKRAIQILLELLGKDDEFILAAAIESLGEIGNIRTIPLILNAVSSPSGSIRERMSRAFISILQRDGEGTLSRQIGQLSKQCRNDLVSFFSSCAMDDTDTWTRVRAVEILGELKAEESLHGLARILSPVQHL